MRKFEILYKFVRYTTTSLKLYKCSVRVSNTKHKIFCVVF